MLSPKLRPRPAAARLTAGVLMLALLPLCAACSTGPAAPRPSRSPAASPAPELRKYSLEQLGSQPCLALDARDLAALGITGQGDEESGPGGKTCEWKLAGQNVGLDPDAPLKYAQTMSKGGDNTQMPVGHHMAVESEFQGICFIIVAVHDVNHLLMTTTIPDPGVSQDGTCPAGASVAAAALAHITGS